MIITKLNGGLGNQMFQYAVGRSLADMNNDRLYLDDSPLKLSQGINTPRNYELYNFNIRAKKINTLGSMILGKINATFSIAKVVKEKSIVFDSTIIYKKGSIILDGYWQSEKYFMRKSNAIKNDFTFITEMDQHNIAILKDIKKTQSVSIHVRRGDYVSNNKTHNFHGVCSSEYYKAAVVRIKKQIKKPTFYVFSDDPTWCRKNLMLDKNTSIVDNTNCPSGVIDMHLMSACQHNIIANSSFSWWGAWLNNNKSKIIIAPKRWFQDQAIDTRDIIPDGWVRL